MKIHYDDEADAAYFYFVDEIKYGEVKKTESHNDDINIDFDKDGKLLGVEVLDASKILRKETLEKATPIKSLT